LRRGREVVTRGREEVEKKLHWEELEKRLGRGWEEVEKRLGRG